MSWVLSEALVKCPKKDCGHEGKLKDFDCYLEEFELETNYEETTLTCPKCGCEFHATIESQIDYFVSEGEILGASKC